MASHYSEHFVCGNCTETLPLVPPRDNLRWCTVNQCIVNISEMYCLGFNWTGETDTDNRLLRFPREDAKSPDLYAQ
jgi:hypothetical protein